jgi:PAS domain-containing protein
MSAAAEILRLPDDPVAKLFPFFANSPVGIALCQRQGYVTALNPALEKMLGIGGRVAAPLSLADLLQAHDLPARDLQGRDLQAHDRLECND